MPAVSQSATWRMARADGWSTTCTTCSMPWLKYFQATTVSTAVMSTILATLAICCLENRLAKPERGLSLLNWGATGLRLKIQPPAATALTTAAPQVSTAKSTLASRPTTTMSCRRVSMEWGADTAAALKLSCWPRANCSRSMSGRASTSMASAPMPRMARWERSRERAVWPSSRAFCSLRSVAGRFLSWLESMGHDERGHAIVVSDSGI